MDDHLSLISIFGVSGESAWDRFWSFPVEKKKICRHLAVQQVSDVDDLQSKDADDITLDQVLLKDPIKLTTQLRSNKEKLHLLMKLFSKA